MKLPQILSETPSFPSAMCVSFTIATNVDRFLIYCSLLLYSYLVCSHFSILQLLLSQLVRDTSLLVHSHSS